MTFIQLIFNKATFKSSKQPSHWTFFGHGWRRGMARGNLLVFWHISKSVRQITCFYRRFQIKIQLKHTYLDNNMKKRLWNVTPPSSLPQQRSHCHMIVIYPTNLYSPSSFSTGTIPTLKSAYTCVGRGSTSQSGLLAQNPPPPQIRSSRLKIWRFYHPPPNGCLPHIYGRVWNPKKLGAVWTFWQIFGINNQKWRIFSVFHCLSISYTFSSIRHFSIFTLFSHSTPAQFLLGWRVVGGGGFSADTAYSDRFGSRGFAPNVDFDGGRGVAGRWGGLITSPRTYMLRGQ